MYSECIQRAFAGIFFPYYTASYAYLSRCCFFFFSESKKKKSKAAPAPAAAPAAAKKSKKRLPRAGE